MQRDFGISRFGDGGNLLTFGDAAGMRQVGLYHGQGAIAQCIKEDPFAHPAFASRNRCPCRLRNLG